MIIYPYNVRLLADDVDTRVFKPSAARTRWLLYVAGPFCPLGARSGRRGQYDDLASRVSALLGLDVIPGYQGTALTLSVRINAATRQRLIDREYARATRKRTA